MSSSSSSTKAAWESVAATKKEQQGRLVESFGWPCPSVGKDVRNVAALSLEGVLSKLDLEITGADVEELLAKLASGEWTSVHVTTAFCHRALIAHKLTNCLTEIFFDQALERAKELDDHLAATGKTVGPLHGLPISLKDQIAVKGVDLSMGYTGWVGRLSEKNAVLTDILLAQGAVLYCKTNVPQSLMLSETTNNVFGTTTNPFNRDLTCGGSSGGEGALVGFRGSPLGVGSDVGGSIRIPSAFQGLFGLRPSFNRVPYSGSANSMYGQEAIPSVLGPISSSVGALKIFIKAVADSRPWLYDPTALRLPWNEDAYQLGEHGGADAKLCFAFMADDGVCKPMPPYCRAIEKTKKALITAGHTVVDYTFPDAAEGMQLLLDIFTADGGVDIATSCALSGEPQLGWMMPVPGLAHLNTFEYWQVCLARTTFIKKQLDALQATVAISGTGRPVDAVICPPSPHASERHGQAQYLYYTGFSNLTDYTTSVFPVTAVDPAVDVKVAAHEFRSAADKMVYDLYEPEVYRDAPISLQCIGRKNEEEAVIRMTEIIAAALKAAE